MHFREVVRPQSAMTICECVDPWQPSFSMAEVWELTQAPEKVIGITATVVSELG